MKFASWNVNGLRACTKKGFPEVFREIDADIFAIQETKMQPDQLEDSHRFAGYEMYMHRNCFHLCSTKPTHMYLMPFSPLPLNQRTLSPA